MANLITRDLRFICEWGTTVTMRDSSIFQKTRWKNDDHTLL